ncbi:hypothetical protein Gpo141_00009299 [Globisporangium polare]
MFDPITTTTTTTPQCAATTAGAAKYRSLAARTARRRSLPASVVAAKAHEYESLAPTDMQRIAPITQTQRSVSCFELGAAARRYQTIHIGKDSAELQELAQANVTQLVQTATSPTKGDSNNALLARKALRYRHKWTPEVESCVAPASY